MFWLSLIIVFTVVLLLVKFDELEKRINNLEQEQPYPVKQELEKMNRYEGTD